MSRIWFQCLKELAQFKRDRLTLSLAFVLPVLSMLLYGFATRLEMKNIPLVVQNFDNSLISRSYIERLFSNEQFIPTMWAGHDVLHNALDTGIAEVGVIIPPDFSRMLRSNRIASAQALIDGTDVNNARVIKNSLIATTDAFLNTSGLATIKSVFKPDIRLWFNPGRKESLYIVPGAYGIVLWIYPSLLAALALAREKEQGTILQAYTSGLTARELIAGKAMSYVVVGIAETMLVLLLGLVIFHVFVVGSLMAFMIGTLIYLFDAVLFGLFIGGGVKSQSAAVQGVAFGGFTTALLLSGYLYPVRNIQYPLSLLAYFIPARYFIELSRDTFVRGSGWPGIWHIPIVLSLFGLLLFFVATRRLGRMQISD